MPEPTYSAQSLTGAGAGHGQEDGRAPAGALPYPVTVEVTRNGHRVGVALRGELDLETSQQIQSDLRQALSRSVSGVDLDLSGVSFCDCSGLNLLLRLRRRALDHCKTVTIGAGSRAVERLLGLTGTRALFPHPNRDYENMTHPACHDAGPRDDNDQDPHVVIAQLRRAMQTRPTIDLARGILMASFNLTPEEAWHVLVAASQNSNTKLHRLADDLVGTIQGGALPDAVQHHLAQAVTKTQNTAPAAAPVSAEPPVSGESPAPPESPAPGALAAEAVPCTSAPDGPITPTGP
ncbi:antitermination regulator [Streptomyces sp. Ru73]|uniref:anti-sigma factor antagonist n=1 Tax=Streptomyces sp. Ru73 TaxID=2080748 RepID=UPI000CDDFABF|nr:anti-sigma factor antagonist [Streptomyces sp. Ru73]POX42646.1 antitermination regulator [Streptomyces sp. Ru73]